MLLMMIKSAFIEHERRSRSRKKKQTKQGSSSRENWTTTKMQSAGCSGGGYGVRKFCWKCDAIRFLNFYYESYDEITRFCLNVIEKVNSSLQFNSGHGFYTKENGPKKLTVRNPYLVNTVFVKLQVGVWSPFTHNNVSSLISRKRIFFAFTMHLK